MFPAKLRHPAALLLCMTFTMSFCFSTWQVLLNNFVIEKAQFTGAEIGILQSLREVPGFLAFTAVFILLVLKEQRFALISLLTLCTGVAVTGFFPSTLGLYITTVVMSLGFHYYETINKSLSLQWISKEEAPSFLGRATAWKAGAALSAYGLIWLAMGVFNFEYRWMYLLSGLIGIGMTLWLMLFAPRFEQKVTQHKRLIVRKRYWLYYVLVFLSGARRQIFMVFAGFMMVEKFHYSVADISALFIINYVFNFLFAKHVGQLIGVIGERRALLIEYTGLVFVFVGYAFVSNAHVAAGLYVIDHLFFAFAIAISTYFQKIAYPEDIAATSSVSFTINHIAAVVVPAVLGLIWLYSNMMVFLIGASLALSSWIFAFMVPHKPDSENRVVNIFKSSSRLSTDSSI